VPAELQPAVRRVLRESLNDTAGDTTTKEQCMRLLATLALAGNEHRRIIYFHGLVGAQSAPP
jgi:hypothetical protein